MESHYDVLVCGAGPAGICAALAAARGGARTRLLEAGGCLGGVWTRGLLSLILDARNKGGLVTEIRDRLMLHNGIAAESWLYDPEAMKFLLEEMVQEAGIDWILHTRAVDTVMFGNRLTHVLVENKSGRSAFSADVFIDATGDGDLAALAGCGYDFGEPGSNLGQPMTLMALISGVPQEIGQPSGSASTFLPKDTFRDILLGVGHATSYSQPSLFPLPNGLFCLMIHHAYEFSGLNARDITEATRQGRAEVMETVRKLRESAAGWESVMVVATAEHIGVREGRRIHGRYTVNKNDVISGAVFDDAVCKVEFPVDVHSLRKADGGGYSSTGVKSKPYDIPYRSLLPLERQGLLLAGRCISGDFYAHASYRVTGDACVTGEAAGRSAAFCLEHGFAPHEIVWSNGAPHIPKEISVS